MPGPYFAPDINLQLSPTPPPAPGPGDDAALFLNFQWVRASLGDITDAEWVAISGVTGDPEWNESPLAGTDLSFLWHVVNDEVHEPMSSRAGECNAAPSPISTLLEALDVVSPGNLRALWLPRITDLGITVSGGHVWTNNGGDIYARAERLGDGVMVTFDGPASGDYSTIPDATGLSYGDGAEDQPFSVAILAKPTDQAVTRELMCKNNGTVGEWIFRIESDDTLRLVLVDQSAGVSAQRFSSVGLTGGELALFGATYTAATGGATAADDITLYKNAVVFASSAGNNASYVAMEDTAADVAVGAYANGSNAMLGEAGIAMIYDGALDLTGHEAIKAAVEEYFKLSL